MYFVLIVYSSCFLSFSYQPNLKPLWGNQIIEGEAEAEEEEGAEGLVMETSDRPGTWGMASQKANQEHSRTRSPTRTRSTGKGIHLQRSECVGQQVWKQKKTFSTHWCTVNVVGDYTVWKAHSWTVPIDTVFCGVLKHYYKWNVQMTNMATDTMTSQFFFAFLVPSFPPSLYCHSSSPTYVVWAEWE